MSDPNAAARNIASTYKGDDGEAYFRGRHQHDLNHLGYRLQAQHYLPYLDASMRVLDFGCGNGSMAKEIAPHVASIEGLEVNDMPRRLAVEMQGLTVYAGLDDIPPGKTYDAIVSNHVFEHIPCVVDSLRDQSRVLHPGGRIVAMVPIEDFRTSLNKDWQGEDVNRHLHTWTPRLFANTVLEAGLVPKEMRIVTQAWTPRIFFLGEGIAQAAFGKLFAIVRRRRQLLAFAERP